MLEAHEVSVSYDQRVAVTNLSLSLQPGKITAIIGPNGAGKSTLLRALNGQIRHSSGSILLDGEPLERLNRRSISRRIAVVAQEAELRFPVTVLEFVLGGRFAWATNAGWGWETERDLQVAQAVLEENELTDLRGRLMNELSGGERQRVSIARAILKDGEPRSLAPGDAVVAGSKSMRSAARVGTRCYSRHQSGGAVCGLHLADAGRQNGSFRNSGGGAQAARTSGGV